MNNRIKNESDRLLLDQLLQIFPSYNDMWLRDLLIDYWHGHNSFVNACRDLCLREQILGLRLESVAIAMRKKLMEDK